MTSPIIPDSTAWVAWIALSLIAIIGFDLLLRSPRRREDRTSSAMLPKGSDPADMRRRRPLTQRLSGAVLLAAVVALYLVLSPLIER